MSRKIIYPFFFTIFPVLYLYSSNISEIGFSETIHSFVINLAVSIMGLLFIYSITKNWFKAGLGATLYVLLFSTYGHILFLFVNFGYFLNDQRPLFIIFIVLLIIGTWLIVRVIKKPESITLVGNFISITLVLLSCFNIFIFNLRKPSIRSDKPIFDIKQSDNIAYLPDIYYIILDGYGSNDMLSSVYGFDNQDFLDFLKDKGFYIADESKSNYVRTKQSLSSSLNLEYFVEGGKLRNLENQDFFSYETLLENSLVRQQLADLGYQSYYLPNSFFSFEWEEIPFPTSRLLANNFTKIFLNTTLAIFFWQKIPFQDHRNMIVDAFKITAEFSNIEGPNFIFTHVLSPHPPFVFDSEGNKISDEMFFTMLDADDLNMPIEEYQAGYIQQLLYINNLTKKMISQILENSAQPPIIIIQGDHGPASYLDFHDLDNNTCLFERYSILNAYYLPGLDPSILYPEISPVNSFRLIFNYYFNENYELLPDLSYFSTTQNLAHNIDVTEGLSCQVIP